VSLAFFSLNDLGNALGMLKGVLQWAFLLFLGLWLYRKTIRHTQAEQLIKGLLVCVFALAVLWGLAHALDMPILEMVFAFTLLLVGIGLMVVFQPELRRIFLYFGHPDRLGKSLGGMAWSALSGGGAHSSTTNTDQSPHVLLGELSEAIRYLSKSKTGALIVLERESPVHNDVNYIEAGTAMDALLSTELLLTLFHPKTPLHDGAVVISPQLRLASAGVLLPLTEDPTLSWQYGTRHRAAIGLSEVSNSVGIVVSEETGHISLASSGRLERMNSPEELKKRLDLIWANDTNHSGGLAPDILRPTDLLGFENNLSTAGLSPVLGMVQDHPVKPTAVPAQGWFSRISQKIDLTRKTDIP
jgi:diadenylate cyclase